MLPSDPGMYSDPINFIAAVCQSKECKEVAAEIVGNMNEDVNPCDDSTNMPVETLTSQVDVFSKIHKFCINVRETSTKETNPGITEVKLLEK